MATEPDVKACLELLTHDMRPAQEFTQATVARARRSVRRRRAGTVAAILSGLVLAGATYGIPLTVHDLKREAWPTDAARHAPPARGSAWAKQLPGGARIKSSFVVGTRLYTPGGVIDLPGTDAEMVGEINSSRWVVAIERSATGDPGTRYAVVSASGVLRLLPATAYQTQNAALATDGQTLAYGDRVIDLRSGRVIARLPSHAVVLLGWTPAGLVYNDMNHQSWVWTPGHDAVPVGVRAVAVIRGTSAVLTATDEYGCAEIRPVNLSGAAGSPTFAGCGDDRPISGSRSEILLADLSMVSRNGRRIRIKGLAGTYAVTSTAFFDRDGNLVVSYPVGPPGVVLVKCTAAPSASCRRSDRSIPVGPDDTISVETQIP